MPQPPVRVLSVIHYPAFGGPHNQVLRLAAPLAARGFTTTVVIPDEPGNAYERLLDGGVDVRRMRLGRLRATRDLRVQRESLGAVAGDVSRVGELMAAEQTDLVVIHGSVNLQAAYAARRRGTPVVVQFLDTSTPRALRLALMPATRALASVVMTTGRAVADMHPGLPRDPERLVHYFPPVDTTRFAPDDEGRRVSRAALGFPEDAVVVGTVSNFTPEKDLETFVEVADRLAARDPRLRFALFGPRLATQAEYAERVLERAERLLADGRLVVRDGGADVASLIRGLDVFLSTSRSEGISTTILEAMSTGLPVVSTDVGAIHEALVDGQTGYLVPFGDRSGLERRIEELAADEQLRASVGAAARAHAVETFDVERCADVHERAFRLALATRRRR